MSFDKYKVRRLQRFTSTLWNSLMDELNRLEVGIAPTAPVARDHAFIPEVEVDDVGVSLNVDGFVYYIKVHPDTAPVKFNLDRPVTDTEFSVVFPGMVKVISRVATTLYLKAPTGQTSRVTVEVLKLG
ncbi:MAG: hypothetical protein QXK11_07325 [Pyrobaculum sp.]|uniref:hypothetical protein n=1 Tax=Pyrobaculum sp. TaxID=2004705 RepID=UPI00316D723B